MFDIFLEMLLVAFTVACTEIAVSCIIELVKYPENYPDKFDRKFSFAVGGIFAIVSFALWYMTYCQDRLCAAVIVFLISSLIIKLRIRLHLIIQKTKGDKEHD